jgi:hypothetical protein
VRHAHGRALLFTLALVLALAATSAADAATLKLACAGKGPRNRDSANTVLCAGSAKHGRTIAGTVRNDAGQPVAGKVTVTFKSWTPSPGGGFAIKPTSTREVTAKPNGTFSVTVNPPTKQSLQFDLAADPALGIGAGVTAEAEVSREVTSKLAKLGGGRIRITVAGTTIRPIKVYVLDSGGYKISGVGAKNVDRRGRASFNLGSRRGQFTYYVDVGKLADLFWSGQRPKFRL